MNELEYFDQRLEGLIAALSPQARKAMALSIAKKLRVSQQQRIKRQQTPDGTPYAPRKPQPLRKKKGRVKREMFCKLRTNRYMKARGSSNSAVVEFSDRVQRMVEVHHYGLGEKIAKGFMTINYAERRLLGYNDQLTLILEFEIFELLSSIIDKI